MPDEIKLTTKLEAYYMFLKSYDQAAIATACGVTTRTIRSWILDEHWREDQKALKERFQRILNALKKDKRVRKEHIPAEHYRAFMLPGLLLLGLELLLGLTLLRRFP